MKDDVIERMEFLRKQILTMEWDASKNQLNTGRAAYFERIKEEYAKLRSQDISK